LTAVIENLEILLQCIKIIKVSNDLLLNLTSVLLTSLFAFLFLAFCYFTFKTVVRKLPFTMAVGRNKAYS